MAEQPALDRLGAGSNPASRFLGGTLVTEDEQENIGANPGYAVGQFVKALLARGETAAKQIKQWQQVLTGMTGGMLEIGSRTPVDGAPAWVTLEVVHGGFATGNFAAGGMFKRYEIDKLLELQNQALATDIVTDFASPKADRTALNIYFAGAEGRLELNKALKSGCFRTHVPEEAALLISTWLIERGEIDRASSLLETLGPFFDRLRFYPEPAASPRRSISGETVYLRTAGACAKTLREKRQQKSVLKMNESIKIWTPLYDRAVNLFIETVEGDVPELSVEGDAGKLARASNGQPIVDGGWPCKHYPENWAARAKNLLQEYEEAKKLNSLCKKHEKPKENFARLRKYLLTASSNPELLSGHDVGSIRRILASYVTAHGACGSERLQKTRTMQADLANQPNHTLLAMVLASRLDKEPEDEGVPNLQPLLVPLSTEEAAQSGARVGSKFPPSIIRKAIPCGEASLSSLIEKKLITSSEAMASVLPMLTARIRASSIADPELARVYADVYQAFRHRRSLLLLNLESQVRFEELPWVSAVQPWVGSNEVLRSSAQVLFARVGSLATTSYPQTIMPNKLVKEFRMLAEVAAVSVPLVDELAADIFMGAFSANFLFAAQEAARLLQGTIYQRYYGIDYERILALNDIDEKLNAQVSPGFARMCVEMAANQISEKVERSVAANGVIVEQGQIITTHNLASLWTALHLEDSLQTELPELARSCFKWICRRQQLQFSEWRTELKSIKNCAYAWRQMLFYISLSKEDEQKKFLSWADAYFNKQSQEFKQRFAPAMQGVSAIIDGELFNDDGHHQSGGQRFIGWSTKPHFLRRQRAVR